VITPERAVDVINERFGAHAGHRALHAKGTVCTGTFTATPVAATLSRAAHLQGDTVAVTARLSNGAGDPDEPDYAPDVRGLAVAFQLPDGSRTVISTQSGAAFPVSNPDAFIELVAALIRRPSMALRVPLFLARNPGAIPRLKASAPALRLPASYATLPYFGVHAFKWIAADGSERFVRYRWEPQAGDQRISGADGKAAGRDYLQDELRRRLSEQPVRFDLMVQIAEPGDRTDDPSSRWPTTRREVHAGTVELTAVTPEEGLLVFDPTEVTDGIELSDDPVLLFRAHAYSVSIDRRLKT